MKMQKSILAKFENSIFELIIWNSEKYEIGTSQFRKNEKSATKNLKLNCDLEFLIQKSNFRLNSKIDLSKSFRIWLRDQKNSNRRCRKPLNLHFRFKFFFDQNIDFVLGRKTQNANFWGTWHFATRVEEIQKF